MKSRVIVTTVVVTMLIMSVGQVAALEGHTDTVTVVSDDNQEALNAAGGVVGVQVGGQSIPVGDSSGISRVGAATNLRLAEDSDQTGITVVGEDVDLQETYFSSLKDNDDNYVYSAATRTGDDVYDTTRNLVDSHYSTANSVVVANPNRVKDFTGGGYYAAKNDVPMLFGVNDIHANDTESLLDNLGVTTVYVTSNVENSYVDTLNSSYTVNTIDTSDGDDFVNSQSASEGELTLVPSVADVSYLTDVAGSNDVMVYDNSTSAGSDVSNYLTSNNPDVNILAQDDDITDNLKSNIQSDTDGTVEVHGYSSDTVLANRIALDRNGVNLPVVVSEDGFSTESVDSGTLVSFTVRNIGYTTAEDVEVTLPKQGGDFSFSSEPADTNGDNITWNIDTLNPNEGETIEYTVSGVGSDEFQFVGAVEEYNNAVGSSVSGFSVFGSIADFGSNTLDFIKGIPAKALGFASSVAGIIPTGSNLAIGVVIALGLLAGGVFVLMRRGNVMSGNDK